MPIIWSAFSNLIISSLSIVLTVQPPRSHCFEVHPQLRNCLKINLQSEIDESLGRRLWSRLNIQVDSKSAKHIADFDFFLSDNTVKLRDIPMFFHNVEGSTCLFVSTALMHVRWCPISRIHVRHLNHTCMTLPYSKTTAI